MGFFMFHSSLSGAGSVGRCVDHLGDIENCDDAVVHHDDDGLLRPALEPLADCGIQHRDDLLDGGAFREAARERHFLLVAHRLPSLVLARHQDIGQEPAVRIVDVEQDDDDVCRRQVPLADAQAEATNSAPVQAHRRAAVVLFDGFDDGQVFVGQQHGLLPSVDAFRPES